MTKEKDISGLENYFHQKDENSEWMERLFEEEKNEPLLKKGLKEKWFELLSKPSPELNLKHILYKVHFDINSKERTRKVSKTRRLYNQFSRIAAILLIPLLTASIILTVNKINQPEQYTEIMAPGGEKARFILPDGSSGYLNSGSTLKYTFPFSKKRMVELSGEAYFDVVHEDKPFQVQVQQMKIAVHGTQFNVCAYKDDPEVVTTLEKGSVSVIREVDGKRVRIKPGQQAVFNKSTHQITKDKVDVDLYVSWKDNMLRFNDAPFADVVKKMERWYDVKIILDDDLKYSQNYTMTIKTESLREMLDLMAITTPLKYEIEEDIVYITNKN